jgi:hypothetical protein
MRRIGLAGVVLALGFLTIVGSAPASTLCLQLKANGSLKGPTTVGGNTCKAGYEKIELPPPAQLETLNKILPHTKYEESGVAGKPTIQFSGVNVQVVSGSGSTSGTVNGTGNLMIGYDENPAKNDQTGSHNLVLGTEQSFKSYGGFIAGRQNLVQGPFASIVGGFGNSAGGAYTSITGGEGNIVRGTLSSITGGEHNETESQYAWIGGGKRNTARGERASISGGYLNVASGEYSSVNGGINNFATGAYASVGGGDANTAEGAYSSIFGGKALTAKNEFEAIP